MISTILTVQDIGHVRSIVDRAAETLAGATSAADILDARDQASTAYVVAKATARIARVKDAHDEVVARAYRLQADALEIESLAKRRLADAFDAAQDRGEIGRQGQRTDLIPEENKVATLAEAGLSAKEIFEARQIRDVIANEPGIVKRVLNDLLAAGDEPTKARLKQELAPAIATLRQEANAAKKERRTAREIELAGRTRALPDKKYNVILADPEWQFKAWSIETGMDRAPDNHYPTSPTKDICARDVESISADDAVLFLWGTVPMLPDALAVMADWGFAYKSHAVWLKQRAGDGRGTGYWFLGEHELLLVGTKGHIPAPAPGTQWRSIIIAPAGEHSEKPELVLELIEAYFPNLPKIELNRRGPARPGWDAWGLEADLAEGEENRSSESNSGFQGLMATPPEGSAEATP